MGDRLSAERACKDPNPIIDGRKANVNLAILGAKPRGNLTQGEFDFFAFFCWLKAARQGWTKSDARSLLQVIEMDGNINNAKLE